MDWQGAPPSPNSYIVKKILRLEIPVDTYPNVCYLFFFFYFFYLRFYLTIPLKFFKCRSHSCSRKDLLCGELFNSLV